MNAARLSRTVRPTDPTTAAAWAFVMENYETIERQSAIVARTAGVCADDVRDDAILFLVERAFAHFDPRKGTARTFIYWQVRKAATEEARGLRAYGKAQQPSSGTGEGPDLFDMMSSTHSGPAAMEAYVHAREVIRHASDEERLAIQSRVEDWEPGEIEHRMGIGAAGRNMRITRFARRVRDDAPTP